MPMKSKYAPFAPSNAHLAAFELLSAQEEHRLRVQHMHAAVDNQRNMEQAALAQHRLAASKHHSQRLEAARIHQGNERLVHALNTVAARAPVIQPPCQPAVPIRTARARRRADEDAKRTTGNAMLARKIQTTQPVLSAKHMREGARLQRQRVKHMSNFKSRVAAQDPSIARAMGMSTRRARRASAALPLPKPQLTTLVDTYIDAIKTPSINPHVAMDPVAQLERAVAIADARWKGVPIKATVEARTANRAAEQREHAAYMATLAAIEEAYMPVK